MNKKIKEIEDEFLLLREKFIQKKMTSQEFKKRLKSLRLRDGQGRCWTIGARTGKWYYFDGKEWIESNPPSFKDGRAVCISCGFENALDAEACVFCGGNMAEDKNRQTWKELLGDDTAEDIPAYGPAPDRKDLILYSLNPISLLLFWGISGLVAGIFIGVLAGTGNYLADVIRTLPSFLQHLQGQLLRGIVFGLLGGIVCFAVCAIFGLLQAFFVNLILYFMGGIKVKVNRTEF